MLIQLVEILEKRGMKIVVSRFEEPVGSSECIKNQ